MQKQNALVVKLVDTKDLKCSIKTKYFSITALWD